VLSPIPIAVGNLEIQLLKTDQHGECMCISCNKAFDHLVDWEGAHKAAVFFSFCVFSVLGELYRNELWLLDDIFRNYCLSCLFGVLYLI
jgi:hypothetical protein